MKKVTIHTQSHSYPIYIGYKTALHQFSSWIKSLDPSQNIIVITSSRIDRLHKIGDFKKIIISDDEKDKNLKTVQKIINHLIRLKADRHTLLIAFGGGVISDITGFVASIYLRGIDFVTIPTTLLSQIDSSLGGKCGVNLPQGKNLMGSFYHPKAIFSDTSFLKTLPPKQFKSGLAEMIKYALIQDPTLYKLLHSRQKDILNKNYALLEELIVRCIRIKKKFISDDEKDFSKRHFLNLGHTLGHALETNSKYKTLTHGEAVAQGMYYALNLSFKKGLCSLNTVQNIESLLKKYDFHPQKISSQVFSHITQDKKRSGNSLPWILIQDIGSVCPYKLPLNP